MIKAIDLLEMSPVIAAIKDDAGLKRCLDTECQVVFILYGNICNIKDIVAKLKAHENVPWYMRIWSRDSDQRKWQLTL